MNCIPSYGQMIHDQLIATFTIASERALLATLDAIATQVGVSTLEGIGIEEFFHRRKTAEAEELIADFADTNVATVSDGQSALDQAPSRLARRSKKQLL